MEKDVAHIAPLASAEPSFVPNKETIAAMLEARNGDLQTFKSVEDLIADLNKDA